MAAGKKFRRPLHATEFAERVAGCDGSNTSGPQVSNSEMNASSNKVAAGRHVYQYHHYYHCDINTIWPMLLSDLSDRYEMGKDELVSCDMLLFFMDNVQFYSPSE